MILLNTEIHKNLRKQPGVMVGGVGGLSLRDGIGFVLELLVNGALLHSQHSLVACDQHKLLRRIK